MARRRYSQGRQAVAEFDRRQQMHYDHYRIDCLGPGHYRCRTCQQDWSLVDAAGFICYEPGCERCPNGCNQDVS